VVHPPITDQDIKESRTDARLRQILLARSLEQLLDSLHRQHASTANPATEAPELREGALMAVKLADMIRAIDDRIQAEDARKLKIRA